jgi:hypothetical protein
LSASLNMTQGRASGERIAPVSSRAGTRVCGPGRPGAGAPGTGQHLAKIAGKQVEVVAVGRSGRREFRPRSRQRDILAAVDHG